MGWRPREITAHGLRWPINFDIVKFRQCSSYCNMPTPIIDSQIFVKNDPHKPKCLWRRTKFWEATPALGPPHRSLLAGGNPRPTRLGHGRIQAWPNPPEQNSTRSHKRASGHPFRPAMGQRTQLGTHTGHLAGHPIIDCARHGPHDSWPSEIPDQRGYGTVEFKHGPIRPCKSLRDWTKGLLGTPLSRPWGSVHSWARIRGTWPSIPSTTAGGTARMPLGRVKSPTNEAVERSNSSTAQSARAKVYASAPKGLWEPV